MRNLAVPLLVIIMLSLTACTPDTSSIGFGTTEPATPEPTPTPLPTPMRVFQSTISADGEVVLPLPPQTFTFQAAGSARIAEVYVQAGDEVQQGDLIAAVDDGDLRNALARAEANLALIEAQIANETAPALDRDIEEARASLAAAQAELQDVLDRPSQEQITQAEADLRLREVDLQRAQEAYDEVAYAQGIGLSPQAAELQQATLNYERAQAAYEEAIKPPTEGQISAARLNVVQADTRLEALLDGVRDEVVAVNDARLREARLQVEEARDNLAEAKLYAPWDGVITEVNAAVGVTAGSATITAVQVEPLRFATNNFSERNLADVEVGDEATLFLKTYPNVPFPAVVQRIELQSSSLDGDTALFTVYFDFNAAEFEVRPGMTGRVEIAIELDR